ncbi:MAG: hypothetical protein M1282_03115, partial [Chloroflexi bacterium]|nr:hypothetical protein [Chloroflexota bacterium]
FKTWKGTAIATLRVAHAIPSRFYEELVVPLPSKTVKFNWFHLGQLDPLFWLAYRSKRPAIWALLSLKPQLLLLAIPKIFSNKRNIVEFSLAVLALNIPFLLVRPMWPIEWLRFLSTYGQNRLTKVPAATVSGEILFSLWALPLIASLILLVIIRRKNMESAFFLANPVLLPYDYSLLMGSTSKIIIPFSWLALWGAWQVKAGWPYALMLIATLVFETIREKSARSKSIQHTSPPD